MGYTFITTTHFRLPSIPEISLNRHLYHITTALVSALTNRGLCYQASLCYHGVMSQSDPNTREELQATVRGFVQGVGFRDFVVRKALALGLRGWTRNKSNGDVEVVAQGTRPALERLLAQLRQGPPAADVAEVQVIWREPSEHISGFHVRW